MNVSQHQNVLSVLVVDKPHGYCRQLAASLREQYSVICVDTTREAEAHLRYADTLPEAILLDHELSLTEGHRLIHTLTANRVTRHLPIILIVDSDETEPHEELLEHHSVDCLYPPISAAVLSRKIKYLIRHQRKHRTLHQHNMLLHEELTKTINELQMVQDVTILALATLTELRNNETGEHIWRTQEYVKVLAQALRGTDRYRGKLTDRDIYLIYKTAPLHDIGKVGIPDQILSKPSPLTSAEVEIIKAHPLIGYNALTQAEQLYTDSDSDFLQYAREICCSHHEKWDGSGYPHGLVGEQIPLAARIMAIADVYDALVTQRAYKQPLSHSAAVSYIANESGRAFDPHIVDVFLKYHAEFKAIADASKLAPQPITALA